MNPGDARKDKLAKAIDDCVQGNISFKQKLIATLPALILVGPSLIILIAYFLWK